MPKFKINGTIILIILLLLMGGGLWYLFDQNSKLEQKLSESNQNIHALTDTLKVTKQKNGDLVYSKSILIASKEELEKLNSDLSDKVMDLEGEILSLTSTIISLEMELDTIRNNKIVNNGGGDYGIKWETKKDFGDSNLRILSGVTNFNVKTDPLTITPINTIITRDYFNLSLVTGLRQTGSILEGFGTSTFPGLEFNRLDTAILRPSSHPSTKSSKKSRFGMGVYSGFGLNINPWTNEVGAGFQIGTGLTFDLF